MHERRFKPENFARLRNLERLELLEVERVVKLSIEGVDAKSVLDVGTGSGVFAESFLALELKVAGVDVSPEMLALAKECVPGVSFREASAEHLPYSDASFDVVFLGLVLHETDDALNALKEARRVATRRVAILEWRDEDQEFGPPRADRLSEEKVKLLSQQARFHSIEPIRLRNLILYRLPVGK